MSTYLAKRLNNMSMQPCTSLLVNQKIIFADLSAMLKSTTTYHVGREEMSVVTGNMKASELYGKSMLGKSVMDWIKCYFADVRLGLGWKCLEC